MIVISIFSTHVTGICVHFAGQNQVHGIRHEIVIVLNLPVPSIGLSLGCVLGMHQAHHVYWGVVLQLRLFVVLLVVLLTLHLGHLHVVHQQGVVLDATEAHMVAPSLLIGLLVLDLNQIQRQFVNRRTIINNTFV